MLEEFVCCLRVVIGEWRFGILISELKQLYDTMLRYDLVKQFMDKSVSRQKGMHS